MNTETTTVEHVCDRLGRLFIASLVGVGKAAVTNAIADNAFSASWYVVIKKECDARQIDCPDYLFRFKKRAVAECRSEAAE